MPVDSNVVQLTGVVFTGLAVVIPIAGITARIALKPFTEAMLALREGRGADAAIGRRAAVLEERLGEIDRSPKVLVHDAEFRRRLAAPRPSALPGASIPA